MRPTDRAGREKKKGAIAFLVVLCVIQDRVVLLCSG